MKNIKLYGDIAKSEDQDDGTVKVWGYASSTAVDSDGESITADAMKAALPDYMKFANVREMHTSKAAGIAIEAEVQADGRTFFGAHVIDSEAVKKVKAGVYKGFSIGGKVTSRDTVNKSIINGLRLAEVSLVDRPANPEAVFNFFKADGLEDDDVGKISGVADATAGADGSGVAKAEGADAPQASAETVTITKAEADEFTAYKAEKKAKDDLRKGMGHVSQLASVLRAVLSITLDQVDEAGREADNSPVPDQLRDWLKQGGEILVAMATEEVGELAATAEDAAAAQPNWGIYMSEKATTLVKRSGNDVAALLEKAGAKFSGSTKKTLGAAHEAMKTACTHLDSMNYADKADDAEDLAKVAGLTDDLAKMTGERDDLAKRVKELEAQPAPTKAVLKVVEKSQDFTDPLVKVVDDGKPKTPEQIMKSIHANPMVMTPSGIRPLS